MSFSNVNDEKKILPSFYYYYVSIEEVSLYLWHDYIKGIDNTKVVLLDELSIRPQIQFLFPQFL